MLLSPDDRLSIRICVTFIVVAFLNICQVSGYQDDQLDPNMFLRRPQRFSFGLGKRASAPQFPPDQFYELFTNWGIGGPHGLFKRSQDPEKEEDDWFSLSSKPALIRKSRGAYSFGLGKRSSPGQYSFGLGKRGNQYGFGLGR